LKKSFGHRPTRLTGSARPRRFVPRLEGLEDRVTPSSSDLKVLMGANPFPNAVPGKSIEYDIQVVNDGPDDVTGASVADMFPAALTNVTYTATPTGGATGFTASGSGDINDTAVDIPANGSILYVATGTISPAATGTMANSATVTAPAGVDPDLSNNTNGFSVALTPQADLRVLMGANPFPNAVPGKSLEYDIQVVNNGPSDVTGASVADMFPAALTNVTYTATPTGGATGFTASGSGNINDTAVNIPAGGSVLYVATGTISSAATGTMANSATVTAPAGVDPDPSNNTDGFSITLTPQADLKITKTDNKSQSAVPGTTITYTITVTNAGPSDAVGATVSDVFPAALGGVTFTAVQTGNATGFTATGSGNIGDTVAMPAGSTITYTATGTISHAATGTLTNTATVTAPTGTTDPDTTNNSASDPVTLTPQADLQISKSAANTVTAATQIFYTISIANNGPSDALAVSISDLLPSGVIFALQTQILGTVTVTLANTGNQINNSIASLPAGGSATIVVIAAVKASAVNTTLMNTATISSTTTDPTPGNNSSTAQTMVVAPVITFAPTTLPNAKAGVSFTQAFTVSGGTGPYLIHTTGTLPAGVSFQPSPNGFTLSGVPRGAGTFHFTLTATDQNKFTGSQSYTWTVAPGDPKLVVFLTLPGSMSSGFLPPVRVAVADQFGNLVSGVTVKLGLVPVLLLGPAGTFIPGSVLQAVTVNGVATFSHVGITGRGGYRLSATVVPGVTGMTGLFAIDLLGRHSPAVIPSHV
jgi:uncharacterized repeat protein (TIGR01451 family)